MPKKLTLEIIKDRLSEINSELEILASEYKGSKEKLLVRCKVDNHEWYANFDNLRQGKGCPKCKAKKTSERRRDMDTVKEDLKHYNKFINIVEDTYINSKTKMAMQCEICHHTWNSTWDNLQTGHGCPECGRKRIAESLKLSMEEVKKRLLVISPNIEIISNEYVNAKTNLSLKCREDDHVWHATWSSLMKGHGCPLCANKPKINIEDVKTRLNKINPNIEILSNVYFNNKTKLQCLCKIDGYKWESCWAHLGQGKGCPKCGGRPKYTIESIKEKMKEVNPHVNILSEEYNNAETKMNVSCKICNEEWQSSWQNLQQGSGCTICGGGYYSVARTERHKEDWLKIKCFLYFIKCYSDNEEFYKIGITKHGVKARFKPSNMPYKYNVVEIIEGNLYNMIKTEGYIQNKLRKLGYSYAPEIKFAGYTECFKTGMLNNFYKIIKEVI